MLLVGAATHSPRTGRRVPRLTHLNRWIDRRKLHHRRQRMAAAEQGWTRFIGCRAETLAFVMGLGIGGALLYLRYRDTQARRAHAAAAARIP